MTTLRFTIGLFVLGIGVLSCSKPERAPTPTPAPASAASSVAPSVTAPRHTGPRKEHPPGQGVDAISGTSDDASDGGAPSKSPKSVGLAAVDFGAAGPLEIRGYPAPLEVGMRDFATTVAYSSDGSEALACGHMTPAMNDAKGAERADTCFFRTRTGKTERAGLEEGSKGAYVGTALAAQLKILADAKAYRLDDVPPPALHAPPLKTTWPYAKDITLMITTLEAKNGTTILRIGGNTAGRDPVYPVMMNVTTKNEDVIFSGTWNAIIASPDNTELAFMGHFFCMEWCNDMVITRLSYNKLASLVFNDTGFQAHKKKDYAASRDLFLKAAWADPVAPLPPYNLACAYALLDDAANASKALQLAIAVGGDKVKARAKKDSDFSGVIAAKWFQDLTK